MRTIMVRYKVKADRVGENEAYIEKVFEELKQRSPGFRYGSFKLDDGVSFVHLVFETGEGDISLGDLPAFQEFTANIGDRCDEPPVASALIEVGSYRLHAD